MVNIEKIKFVLDRNKCHIDIALRLTHNSSYFLIAAELTTNVFSWIKLEEPKLKLLEKVCCVDVPLLSAIE